MKNNDFVLILCLIFIGPGLVLSMLLFGLIGFWRRWVEFIIFNSISLIAFIVTVIIAYKCIKSLQKESVEKE